MKAKYKIMKTGQTLILTNQINKIIRVIKKKTEMWMEKKNNKMKKLTVRKIIVAILIIVLNVF